MYLELPMPHINIAGRRRISQHSSRSWLVVMVGSSSCRPFYNLSTVHVLTIGGTAANVFLLPLINTQPVLHTHW